MIFTLNKALDKNKLVQVPVQVSSKHGVFTRQQWKKIGDLTSDEMKAAGINLAQKGFRKANPETKAFVDNLAKELGDEKLLEEIKARGITWSENSNVGINKMHAKMRLREWLEDGGTWDSSKTKEKPDPFVDAIKEFVSKLTSTSRVTEARAMEMAQELVNKADLGDISYLLERLNAGNPLSIKLFGSIKGIKIKTQKDVRAALEKFYPEKWKEYHEKLAQEKLS